MREWIILAEALMKWHRASEKTLGKYAASFVGWATNEMGDPEDLSFTFTEQFPLSELEHYLQGHSWEEYYESDVASQEIYAGLIDEDFKNPIVVSYEDDQLILWDGYHRVATAFYRGDDYIAAIVGRQK